MATAEEKAGFVLRDCHDGPGGRRPLVQEEKDRFPWSSVYFPKRYILAFMAFLGFCNVYALRVNLSVAIVQMVSNGSHINANGTKVIDPPPFDWNSQMEGIILGAFFYGYIVTQLPGGVLANKFGGKFLFGGGIFATALLTLLTPVCARWDRRGYLLISLRVLEGIFEGVTYPCIHALLSKWAPPLERSKLATVAFSGSYIGTCISMPLSGVLAEKLGWDSIFYVFGAIAILWFVAWCFIVKETPSQHLTISRDEALYIHTSVGFSEQQTKHLQTPWLSMVKSLPVWAIIVAHFCENWGFYTLLTTLPTFMYDVLGYDIMKSGFLSAVPYLVMGIVVQLGGQLADFIRRSGRLTTTAVRKIFNCGAFLSQALCIIGVAYTMNPAAAVTMLTISVSLGGFAWSGFSVNHLDIAPQFASILMGISNTVATLPGIISPPLTGAIVSDRHDVGEWRIVFYIAAIIYFSGAVFYGLFASGECQEWAQIPLGYEAQDDDKDDE